MGEAHRHEHRLLSGGALTRGAQAAVEAAGEQWTAMRAAVHGALVARGRPASAYDIAEDISRAEGRRIAANSIYRILDLFLSTNVVQRIESANAYVANAHPGCVHDCIYLVCDRCGSTTHLDDDGVSARVRAAARGAGFAPVRPVIEVRGMCAACTH